MTSRKIILIILTGSCNLLCFCNGHTHLEKQNKPADQKPLMEINRKLVENKQEEINSWAGRHGYKTEKTGSGLQYVKIKEGAGKKAKNGWVAKIKYDVSLIDGTPCYSSSQKGPMQFLIGQDHVESGLHEGIQLMKEGDRMILLIPPHLAYGLLGDDEKIPPMSVLVYDVELLGLYEK